MELKNAMKEILEAIKNSKETGAHATIEIPSLERLLHVGFLFLSLRQGGEGVSGRFHYYQNFG